MKAAITASSDVIKTDWAAGGSHITGSSAHCAPITAISCALHYNQLIALCNPIVRQYCCCCVDCLTGRSRRVLVAQLQNSLIVHLIVCRANNIYPTKTMLFIVSNRCSLGNQFEIHLDRIKCSAIYLCVAILLSNILITGFVSVVFKFSKHEQSNMWISFLVRCNM